MLETTRLLDIPQFQLNSYPNASMFVTKRNGVWESMSTKEFVDFTDAYAKGLIALGINIGDKVGLVASNRVEWNIMDIAIQKVGGIVVPIYPNISVADYQYILNDANITACFVGGSDLYEKISIIKETAPCLNHLFNFDQVSNQTHWSSILKDGETIDYSIIAERIAQIKYEDLATIIYTSGTTGNPKGVMLSHKNILSNVEACRGPIPADRNSKVLTFLPVCHIYERMLHYLYMYLGCSIYFAESMDTIGDNIREVKPDVFTAVPRLIEKVYDRILARGEELTGIKRKLFFWAVAIAEQYDVKGKSVFYKIKLGIARKLIFSKWREALGGNVRAIASGSAALQPRLARIFLAAEIPILEGYGLTETSPVISVNHMPNDVRIGTVGPLIDQVKVMIAEDGEILVKGPNVMMGYYNLPEATAEAIDAEGWFHTGDIGEFVEERYLKITDRKKEIFKTSGGKYIVPQAMENKFKESRFIEQRMVVGEGQKFPAAFIVPSYSFVKDWAARKKIDLGDGSNASICSNPQVCARIMEEVEGFNKGYGNWEKIKKIELLSSELSIEGGDLTPTLKLKRKKILEKYHHLLEKIYAE